MCLGPVVMGFGMRTNLTRLSLVCLAAGATLVGLFYSMYSWSVQEWHSGAGISQWSTNAAFSRPEYAELPGEVESISLHPEFATYTSDYVMGEAIPQDPS